MSAGVKVANPPLSRAFSEDAGREVGQRPRPKLKRSLSANVRLSLEEKKKKVIKRCVNNYML